MLAEAPNSNALSMIGSQTRCLKLIPNALYSNVSELGGDLFPLLVEIKLRIDLALLASSGHQRYCTSTMTYWPYL